VQARLQELRLMRDRIPRFLIPDSPREALRLNSAASVPPEFVEKTAVAGIDAGNSVMESQTLQPKRDASP
jgi:hypothetical protein